MHLPTHTLGVCPSRDLSTGGPLQAVFPNGAHELMYTLVCAYNTTDTVEHTLYVCIYTYIKACTLHMYICPLDAKHHNYTQKCAHLHMQVCTQKAIL